MCITCYVFLIVHHIFKFNRTILTVLLFVLNGNAGCVRPISDIDCSVIQYWNFFYTYYTYVNGICEKTISSSNLFPCQLQLVPEDYLPSQVRSAKRLSVSASRPLTFWHEDNVRGLENNDRTRVVHNQWANSNHLVLKLSKNNKKLITDPKLTGAGFSVSNSRKLIHVLRPINNFKYNVCFQLTGRAMNKI